LDERLEPLPLEPELSRRGGRGAIPGTPVLDALGQEIRLSNVCARDPEARTGHDIEER
jgi:hypothetical protein